MVLEVIKNESKNKDDSINSCLEKLNVNLSEVYYYTFEENSGLFGKKKYTCFMVTKYSVKDYIRNFLNELAKNMNTMFNIEINENEGIISVLIISDKNGILIGKDGQTLKSIQMILRQSLKKYGNFDIKINLDIAGYKEKRERNIIFEAKKIAREVKKSHLDAKLDPMNSYERRLVHTALSNYKNIQTESEGIDPNRYVMIKYID